MYKYHLYIRSLIKSNLISLRGLDILVKKKKTKLTKRKMISTAAHRNSWRLSCRGLILSTSIQIMSIFTT